MLHLDNNYGIKKKPPSTLHIHSIMQCHYLCHYTKVTMPQYFPPSLHRAILPTMFCVSGVHKRVVPVEGRGVGSPGCVVASFPGESLGTRLGV